MMTNLNGFLLGLFAAVASASAFALPSPLSLDDELTLSNRHPDFEMTTEAQTRPTYLNSDGIFAPQEPTVLDADRAPERPGSATDIEGMNYADLKNDVLALAYRSPRGLGLGLASTGGVAFTGGYATESGMRVNLYYIQSFSEITGEASRVTGLDLTNVPTRSVGITVGWKF